MQNVDCLFAHYHTIFFLCSDVTKCLLHLFNGELHLLTLIAITPSYWFREKKISKCNHFNQISLLLINQGVRE